MNMDELQTYCRAIRSGDLSVGKLGRSPDSPTYIPAPPGDQKLVEKIFRNSGKVAFVPNLYRYDIKRNIAHYVLWFHPSHYDSVPDDETIEEYITDVSDGKPHVWHENPPEWKSVSHIPHVHVFIDCANNNAVKKFL